MAQRSEFETPDSGDIDSLLLDNPRPQSQKPSSAPRQIPRLPTKPKEKSKDSKDKSKRNPVREALLKSLISDDQNDGSLLRSRGHTSERKVVETLDSPSPTGSLDKLDLVGSASEEEEEDEENEGEEEKQPDHRIGKEKKDNPAAQTPQRKGSDAEDDVSSPLPLSIDDRIHALFDNTKTKATTVSDRILKTIKGMKTACQALIEAEKEDDDKSDDYTAALQFQTQIASLEKALENKEYQKITATHLASDYKEDENSKLRDQFLSLLDQQTQAFSDLIDQHRQLALSSTEDEADQPGHSPWFKKLLAYGAILLGTLVGALGGALVGSLAGPGGTVLGGIKGAIEGGGAAAALTIGGGVVGGAALGYTTYHYCARSTLFPPEIKGKPVETPADENMVALIEESRTLVATVKENVPKPGKK